MLLLPGNWKGSKHSLRLALGSAGTVAFSELRVQKNATSCEI